MLSRRLALAAVLLLIVAGVAFFQAFSFRFWEGTLKGPYSGFPIAPVHQAKINSQLELPRRHLLEVSNAYANAGGVHGSRGEIYEGTTCVRVFGCFGEVQEAD